MANKEETFITTIDNPYNYFDEFDQWFNYDVLHHYNTLSYVGRVAMISNSMTDEEISEEIDRALDSIISFNPGLYVKTYPGKEIIPLEG